MMKDIYLFSYRLKRARKLMKLTQAGIAQKLRVRYTYEPVINADTKEVSYMKILK